MSTPSDETTPTETVFPIPYPRDPNTLRFRPIEEDMRVTDAQNWSKPDVERWHAMNDKWKKGLGFLGVVAGGLLSVLPPHTVAWKIAAGLTALLAGGGIVSSGVHPKPK